MPTSADRTRSLLNRTAASSAGLSVEVLQELVCCEFDLLVPPLCGTVVAGDQPHSVQTAEVAVDKRVARLRLLGRAVGEAEMPGVVLLPGVRLQERVLLPCARLHVLPTRAEHILARVDQPLRVPDRVLVHRVGGHARILADPCISDCSGGSVGPRIERPRALARSPKRPAQPVLYLHARARDETDEEAFVDQVASRRPRGDACDYGEAPSRRQAPTRLLRHTPREWVKAHPRLRGRPAARVRSPRRSLRSAMTVAHLILRRKRWLRQQLRSSTLVKEWLRPTGGTSEPG